MILGEEAAETSRHPAPVVAAWRGGESWQGRRPMVGSSEKRVKDLVDLGKGGEQRTGRFRERRADKVW